MGALDLPQLLARNEAVAGLHVESSERLVGTGVEVVDIRLNRTELPANALQSAYAQMREQRRALASDPAATFRKPLASMVSAERLSPELTKMFDTLATRSLEPADGGEVEESWEPIMSGESELVANLLAAMQCDGEGCTAPLTTAYVCGSGRTCVVVLCKGRVGIDDGGTTRPS